MSDNDTREGFWKNIEKAWTFWLILGMFLSYGIIAWLMEINHVPEICKHLYLKGGS